MEKFSKNIPIILTICFIAYIFMYSSYVESRKEKFETEIEILEEENRTLKTENKDLNSEIENLEEKNLYNEELINILQQQLEDNGLKPNEL